jgi:hypothetical protein
MARGQSSSKPVRDLRFSDRDYGEYCLLGNESVKSGRILPRFRREVLFRSSGWKNKPRMRVITKLDLCFNLEDWGSKFLLNVGKLVINYTSHPRSQSS